MNGNLVIFKFHCMLVSNLDLGMSISLTINICHSFRYEGGIQGWPQDILNIMSEQAESKAELGKCGHLGWQKGLFSGSKRTAHSKQVPECTRTFKTLYVCITFSEMSALWEQDGAVVLRRIEGRLYY